MIFRHGHAQDYAPEGDIEGDFVRELQDKGKRNAQRVGVWMARNDLRPDYVISSPATRAKRTAEKSCKTAGLNSDIVLHDERIYGASVEDLLEVIRGVPNDAKRLLLVGHNPALKGWFAKFAVARFRGPRREQFYRLRPWLILPLTAIGMA